MNTYSKMSPFNFEDKKDTKLSFYEIINSGDENVE